MSDEELDEIDNLLLPFALDSKLSAKLNDIIDSKPRNIARDMKEEDIRILSNYLFLPRNNSGKINIKSARQVIERLLITYPFLKRENSNKTRNLIVSYYKSHPEIPRPQPYKPIWLQNINISNSTN